MKKILFVLLVIPAPALGQPYVATGFGLNVAPELTFEGYSTGGGGGSVCDEYINPRYAELPQCAGPPRESAHWTSVFDRAAGVLGNAAVGYRAAGWLRVEAEYFYRDSAYDQTSPILGATGERRETLMGEVERAREHVYGVTSNNLFANIYVDFDTGSRFTPYLGFGAGVGFTDIDNGRVLARRLDPATITSVPDYLSNAEEVRRNLAGTTTSVITTDTDTMWAYQALFGTDIAVGDAVALGVKGRWVWYGLFEADGPLDQLRSHPPNYRLDGSRPITYHRTIEGVQMVGVSVELKYYF